MEKIDILDELKKAEKMVKDKIEKDQGFPAFVVSFGVNGNKMAQLEQWQNEDEKKKELTDAMNWLKSEHPVAFIFGSLAFKKKYSKKEDYKKGENYVKVPSVILVAKTPDKSWHLSLEYKDENGKLVFATEELYETTNDGSDATFLDDIFSGTN